MKPTLDVPPGLLDNESAFDAPFFKRFDLRRPERPIDLGDGVLKNYWFPTFYDRVGCAMTVFPCDCRRAEKLIAERLHPAVKPVSMTRGRALIAFACYQYRTVMGIPPYNEIAVTIPVMANARFRPPILPIVAGGFSRFGYFVVHMPVTSQENTLRGQRIWGLPKVTEEVRIRRDGTICETTALTAAGAPYLTVRARADGRTRRFDERLAIFSRLHGQVIVAESRFTGAFNVVQHTELLWRKRVEPDRAWLELGDGPEAAFLRELDIEPHPFIFRFTEHMSSVFDLPPRAQPRWLRALNRA